MELLLVNGLTLEMDTELAAVSDVLGEVIDIFVLEGVEIIDVSELTKTVVVGIIEVERVGFMVDDEWLMIVVVGLLDVVAGVVVGLEVDEGVELTKVEVDVGVTVVFCEVGFTVVVGFWVEVGSVVVLTKVVVVGLVVEGWVVGCVDDLVVDKVVEVIVDLVVEVIVDKVVEVIVDKVVEVDVGLTTVVLVVVGEDEDVMDWVDVVTVEVWDVMVVEDGWVVGLTVVEEGKMVGDVGFEVVVAFSVVDGAAVEVAASVVALSVVAASVVACAVVAA